MDLTRARDLDPIIGLQNEKDFLVVCINTHSVKANLNPADGKHKSEICIMMISSTVMGTTYRRIVQPKQGVGHRLKHLERIQARLMKQF